MMAPLFVNCTDITVISVLSEKISAPVVPKVVLSQVERPATTFALACGRERVVPAIVVVLPTA